MNRTIAWLVTLGFGAGAVCLAADYPLPRMAPVQRLPIAQKKDADNAKNSKDTKEKDTKDTKDTKDKDEKDTKDTKDAKNGKNGKDEKEDKDKKNGKGDEAAAKPAANLWPHNPFPPAAQPVLDPRTGAWEQVVGPAGVEAGDGGIFPPPGPEGVCLPGNIAQLQPPVPVPTSPLMPVSGVVPQGEVHGTTTMVSQGAVQGQIVSPASRGGLSSWLDRMGKRTRTQAPRERTINISKNAETGSWEIEEVHKPPR